MRAGTLSRRGVIHLGKVANDGTVKYNSSGHTINYSYIGATTNTSDNQDTIEMIEQGTITTYKYDFLEMPFRIHCLRTGRQYEATGVVKDDIKRMMTIQVTSLIDG